MKVTKISAQVRDKNRINISIDGKYRFSLDINQLVELGLKVGNEYSEEEIIALEQESQYGKLYGRTLEYILMRPHSQKEVRDYLYRKTRDTRTKTGDIRKGVSKELTERVFDRLHSKGYLNDENFARFWIENRNVRKGASLRKIVAELKAKGVDATIIDSLMSQTDRSDTDELRKVIERKRRRYDDDQKFMAYLARQGFRYDDIKEAFRDQD